MDILVLAELVYSIMQGKNNPEYMTPVFFQNFVPLALMTLISAKILIKRFKTEPVLTNVNPEAIRPR